MIKKKNNIFNKKEYFQIYFGVCILEEKSVEKLEK